MTNQFDITPDRKKDQVRNSVGAVTFKVTPWTQLERFLVLGSEGGSYHVGEDKLTRDNAVNTIDCIQKDGRRAVDMIVDVSDKGRAHKNNPALFALAIAASDSNDETRRLAFDALPKVARTATHLFTFVSYMQTMRGWGKAPRKAISKWYTEKEAKTIAYQMVKYQQRDGWTHRDLLRLAHPATDDREKDALFRWAVSGMDGLSDVVRRVGKGTDQKHYTRKDLSMYLHPQVRAFEEIKSLNEADVREAVRLISEYDLPREAVPTHFLNSVDVWTVLLNRMPMTAAIRNLATMTRNGTLDVPENKDRVMEMITNEEYLKRSRIHPLQVLMAHKTYAQGRGVRGQATWTVDKDIVKALDKAFYKTFQNVEPTGKRICLALDISGSMSGMWGSQSVLSPREIVAALALVTLNTEQDAKVIGFSNEIMELKLKPNMTLETACKYMSGLPFGATDAAAPFLWALEKKLEFDAFGVYTDNDTGTGSYWGWGRRSMQPADALRKYREETGIPARLAVLATEPYNYSIADPKDAGMLDICGFDGSVPAVISDFFRG